MQSRVDLLGGRDIIWDPSPGRIFIVGPSYSCAVGQAVTPSVWSWGAPHRTPLATAIAVASIA